MSLKTPLGEIEIFIDNKKIEYDYKKIEINRTCENLNGRYLITIQFIPDGLEHKISCRIKNYNPSIEDEVETGEDLELKSFYYKNIKMSIGMIGDTEYYSMGERICNSFDYNNDYLKDGVEYVILKITKTEIFDFGIAWIEGYTNENEVQTWYGADPFTFKN